MTEEIQIFKLMCENYRDSFATLEVQKYRDIKPH
jgi:hypothetical protein